jgi:hypothetical protein
MAFAPYILAAVCLFASLAGVSSVIYGVYHWIAALFSSTAPMTRWRAASGANLARRPLLTKLLVFIGQPPSREALTHRRKAAQARRVFLMASVSGLLAIGVLILRRKYGFWPLA